jgi:TetR/AcrR family transcriptional repressor of nem operon
MARQIEFDENKVLEKATHLFWQKGYSNTSLRDLMEAMGIGQGSFYNFVKNKKELYLQCLIHYNATVTKRRWDALTGAPTAAAGVRALFKCILDDLDHPNTPNVCLMAGSLATDVLSEKSLSKYIVEEMNKLEQALIERIDTAKKKKEVSSQLNSKIVASAVITYLQGFFRVVKVLKTRREMEEQVEFFIKGLGL